MVGYLVVQDWLTLSVDNTANRVQEKPVRVGPSAFCDLLINVTMLGNNSKIVIEGSDPSGQNFRELLTVGERGKTYIRLRERFTSPPTFVRWVASNSGSIPEKMCFAVEAFVGGEGGLAELASPAVRFQDWVTIQVPAGEVVSQLAAYQYETSGLKSLTCIPTIANRTSAAVTIYLETAHSPTGPWLRSAALQNRIPTTLIRTGTGEANLGNYVRWVAESTTAEGSATFALDCSGVPLARATSAQGAMMSALPSLLGAVPAAVNVSQRRIARSMEEPEQPISRYEP